MIGLGHYTATNGQNFDLRYIPETKNAVAIGPIPGPQSSGGPVGEYVNLYNVSPDEWVEKIKQAIEQEIAEKPSGA